MTDYQAPLRDMQFVINELADLNSLNQLPAFAEATPDLVEAVLEQAAILAGEVFSPLNHSGDEHGTFIDAGKVVSPSGYAEAFRQFAENGWQGIGKSEAYDGQGLPFLVHLATSEMWNSANLALALCPLLTSGAIEALESHASEALKQAFLPRLVSGEWTGGAIAGCAGRRKRHLALPGAQVSAQRGWQPRAAKRFAGGVAGIEDGYTFFAHLRHVLRRQ